MTPYKFRLLLAVAMMTLIFTSCQKELSFQRDANGNGTGNGNGNPPGTDAGNITGNYRFVGMSSDTWSSLTLNTGGMNMKTIATSVYTTTNNSGALKIDATNFQFTNLSYDLSTVVSVEAYMDNVLMTQMDQPWDFSLAPTNTASSYQRISADSVYFPSGFAASAPTGTSTGASYPTGPMGARLSWSGDTLLMRMKLNVTQTQSSGGVPATLVGKSNSLLKFKKN